MAAGAIWPASMAASRAIISLTRIMMDEMQVLKCQRPLKSSSILAIVWCSTRNRSRAGPLIWPAAGVLVPASRTVAAYLDAMR